MKGIPDDTDGWQRLKVVLKTDPRTKIKRRWFAKILDRRPSSGTEHVNQRREVKMGPETIQPN